MDTLKVWPKLFRSVDHRYDDDCEPNPVVGASLACWCYVNLRLDHDLAWWIPTLVALCKYHKAAQALPLRKGYAKRKRSLAPLWNLHLTSVEPLYLASWYRLGFRCGCIANAHATGTLQWLPCSPEHHRIALG